MIYSLLPASVSVLFLAYGIYVLAIKGFSRITATFFALCLTTFFWQATWAVLFQVKQPELAMALVRFGYLMIIFLPTTLYHFLTEIAGRTAERRWVMRSYALAAVLGVLDLSTDWFVAGYYSYFWGYYPKAGPLHPIHVLQTVTVATRGLYITWRAWQQATSEDQQARLRTCLVSLLIYFFAAVDYLCNYGFGFYPPGVVFIAIVPGAIAFAVARQHLMGPLAAAHTIAHELRTPMATIRMQATLLASALPELQHGYALAVAQGLMPASRSMPAADTLNQVAQGIAHQVDRSNSLIDTLLVAARADSAIDPADFSLISVAQCVQEALDTYPFGHGERECVRVTLEGDFSILGLRHLLVFVLINLLKNSLFALKVAGKGDIAIVVRPGDALNQLLFTDTGSGIPPEVLPRIFDTYFTTKKSAGLGIGLAFCQRVVKAFGASMRCESQLGEYTRFSLSFPVSPQSQTRDLVQSTTPAVPER